MPAIDAALPATPTAAPATAADARPAAQNPAKGLNTADGDSHASDAFIAALLAQSTVQATTPEQVAPAPADVTPGIVTGQDLPLARPSLAANPAIRRPVTPLAPDTAPLESHAPEAAPDEFANALVALQDAMTGGAGGTGGERGSEAGTAGEAAGATKTIGMLADLGAATNTTPTRNDIDPGRALEALTGAHAARAHEAPSAAQAYAAKPAPLPMDQPAMFAERLNQHISFMIGDQVQSAQIAVTPADLGPVEVRVTLSGDEARIQLSATHAATREALNEALPRLRASFADAGIALSQAGVFAQMPERQQAEPSFSSQARAGDGDFEAAPLAAVTPARSLKVGLIDAFV